METAAASWAAYQGAGICDLCGAIAPHSDEVCMKDVRRKLKIAGDTFNSAISLVHALGEPETMKDRDVALKAVTLDVICWRFAM